MAIERYLLVVLCTVANYGDTRALGPEELYLHAEARRRMWDLDGAARMVARGERAWRARPDSDWHWRFRLLSAEILLEQGRAGPALALLDGNPPARDLEARRRMNLATGAFRQGRVAQASAAYEQARRLAADGPPALLSEIEIKQAYLLALDRHFQEAGQRIATAVARIRGQDPYLEAYAHINLGFLRMREGRLEEAIAPLERARELSEGKGGSRRAAVLALGNQGTCYVRLGDFDRALHFLTRAVDLAARIGDKVDEKGYLGDIGSVYYRLEDYRKAVAYYQRSEALGAELNDRVWVSMMLNNLAEASLKLGELEAAAEFNRKALEIKRKIGRPGSLAFSIMNAGEIALAGGRVEEASARLREALELAKAAGEPSVEWAAHAGLASADRAAGRPAEAQYERAIEVVDREWARLSQDQSRVTFLAQLIRLFQEYVDYLVERGASERALLVAESSRARVLAQKLGAAGAAPAIDARRILRLAAGRRAAFLAYWLAPRRSFLWTLGASGIRRFDLPGEAEICARVRAYSESLERRRDPLETGNENGRWLYRNLIMPAAASVPRGGRVVVVPDGCLYQLNPETLPALDGRYWLEQAAVAVAPSLGVLEPGSVGRAAEVLVIGDPVPTRDFPALPSVKPEIESIRACYPGARLYTGPGATPRAYLASQPVRFDIIHFAAHATANRESPLDSAVILSGEDGAGRLYARDVLKLPLRAGVVTISACRSAGSRSYSGEGLIGFTWAFLRAGARNVIAGLWDADDDATARLMGRLYRERAAGARPADALRAAKLELLSSAETRAPYYWGPFEVFTRAAE